PQFEIAQNLLRRVQPTHRRPANFLFSVYFSGRSLFNFSDHAFLVWVSGFPMVRAFYMCGVVCKLLHMSEFNQRAPEEIAAVGLLGFPKKKNYNTRIRMRSNQFLKTSMVIL
ncbi:hypothetical protein AABB24_018950, partial [Solanum stoloniferum]